MMSPYTFQDDPFAGGEDDGDTNNSLAVWAREDAYYASLAEITPATWVTCPDCGEAIQNDPPDPDTGIRTGVVYCENPRCYWPGLSY